MGLRAIDEQGPPPDEGERPSQVVSVPACVVCDGPLGTRPGRGACQTCWRKFRAAGLRLPDPRKPGPRAGDPLHEALACLAASQRSKAIAYLGELVAREPPKP